MSILDWSSEKDVSTTLTRDRLQRFCGKLGDSSCKRIILRNAGLSNFPSLLRWLSGVSTWEHVDASENMFETLCGESCSRRGNDTCAKNENECYNAVALLNDLPNLKVVQLANNFIDGVCSEGAGRVWRKL